MTKLLIVDDDRSLADLLTLLLIREGFEVDTKYCAEDAIEHLQIKPVDIVLTDLLMPGMGGAGLIRWLRERGSDIPIVVLTGKDDTRDVPNVIPILRKPFKSEELVGIINGILTA